MNANFRSGFWLLFFVLSAFVSNRPAQAERQFLEVVNNSDKVVVVSSLIEDPERLAPKRTKGSGLRMIGRIGPNENRRILDAIETGRPRLHVETEDGLTRTTDRFQVNNYRIRTYFYGKKLTISRKLQLQVTPTSILEGQWKAPAGSFFVRHNPPHRPPFTVSFTDPAGKQYVLAGNLSLTEKVPSLVMNYKTQDTKASIKLKWLHSFQAVVDPVPMMGTFQITAPDDVNEGGKLVETIFEIVVNIDPHKRTIAVVQNKLTSRKVLNP